LQKLWASASTLFMIGTVLFMNARCAKSIHFGGSILPPRTAEPLQSSDLYFSTPLVPFLPCLGIAVNWYLIAQLEASGIVCLLLYLGASITIYFVACARNSVGHRNNWHASYEFIAAADDHCNGNFSSASLEHDLNATVERKDEPWHGTS
jgi:hypothetical protein